MVFYEPKTLGMKQERAFMAAVETFMKASPPEKANEDGRHRLIDHIHTRVYGALETMRCALSGKALRLWLL